MEINFERPAEIILNRAQVTEAMARFAEGGKFERELSDEHGPYLLEVSVPGEKPGEVNLYEYKRKGNFPNNNEAAETVINVVHLEDGVAVGGKNVAQFNYGTSEWEAM